MSGNTSAQSAIHSAQLTRTVENTLSSFPELSRRPMFGTVAYFIRGNVVAFVGKEGHLGLKVTDQAVHAAALEIDGVEPFAPGGDGKAMKNWLLIGHGALPEADLEELLEMAAAATSSLPAKAPRQRRQRVK